ncbi:MAG: translation initiation factor IF-2 [Candidatus Micrarchaeia archaeon]
MRNMAFIRQPIVVVMGHVDHGKTMLLDSIRNTSVHKREKGAITQHIGASEVPADVLKSIGGTLIETMKLKITIPGLLFIDTPGHEAFTSLRRRGGSIADIAVLVVDASQGFQPQTAEAINILKEYKTPFIVALNKIDLISGWKPQKTSSFLESLPRQQKPVQDGLDSRIYDTVSKLAEFGFNSERFDRVTDFTKEVAIVPVSAKTQEGIAEILIMLTGLAQKFLENRLHIDQASPGRASIIEVKEVPGLGKTLDAILYDGTIRVNDYIAFATLDGHKVTHIRAMLRPKPLDEMRDPKDKFSSVCVVSAAAGIKIAAPDIEGAIPGSTLIVVKGSDDSAIDELRKEVTSVLSFSEGEGVTVRADTLGSLEAAIRLLSGARIKVRSVGIGAVSRKDVADCAAVSIQRKIDRAILAFNVKVPRDVEQYARECKVKIFEEGVIYRLIEEFSKWKEEVEAEEKRNVIDKLQPVAQMHVIPGCCFRTSKPAVFGVKVMVGKIRPDVGVIDENGNLLGKIKSIQEDKASLDEATAGAEVAISIDGITFGKEVVYGKTLYTYVPKKDADLYLEKYNNVLSENEISLLMHILRITRQRLG